MSDPLSIIASLIAVVQISGTIISVCYDYRRGVKKAPQDVARITNEITSLRDVLESLIRIIDEDDAKNGIRLATIQKLNVPEGPLPSTKKELEDLEAKLRPEKGWRAIGKALVWPLRKGEVDGSLEIIRRMKETLNLALLADHTLLMLDTYDVAKSTEADVKDLTKTIERREKEQADRNIIQWLNILDQSSYFQNLLERRHNGSGEWLLKNLLYLEWKKTGDSLLWLYGIPGCGKTMLCATIIEDLISYCDPKESKATVYYYVDFSDERTSSVNHFLRSILTQLATQTTDFPEVLEKFYHDLDSCNLMKSASYISTATLVNLLTEVTKNFGQIYLVIDALDECVEREKILQFIGDTLRWKTDKLHWLVSSRAEIDIERELVKLCTARISLEGNPVDDDIHLYILDQLQNDRKLSRLSEEVKKEIEEALVRGAQGMFRWVICQIDALSRCSRLNTLRATLQTLPKSLDETYSRILTKISEEDCQDALYILQWLSFSFRPVRLDEVAEALSIDWKDPENPLFTPDLRLLDIQSILVMCSSLITTSKSFSINQDHPSFQGNQELRLAHFSVKEFLISDRIMQSSVSRFKFEECVAHLFLAQSCIAYLLQFEAKLDNDALGQLPLVKYASRYWINHVHASHQIENSKTLQQLCLRLLKNGAPYDNYLRIFDPEKHWNYPVSGYKSYVRDSQDDLFRRMPPLYLAAMEGFYGLSNLIIDRGDDPDEEGGIFGCPLIVAALKGYETIVQLFLLKGAEVNKNSGFLRFALVAAIQGSHTSVVRLLIRNGAEVNPEPFGLITPLQRAVSLGNPEITKLLIDYGADVNRRHYKSSILLPLEEAIVSGFNEIIYQLLPKADLESLNTGLLAGLECHDWNMCKELLKYGANKDLLLFCDDQDGVANIVQELRDQNADADVASDPWHDNNPLIAAILEGHETVAKELLANGADVSRGTFAYANALQAAVVGGNNHLVQLILNTHLDINASGREGTALSLAAVRGHLVTVQLLLKNGADPNCQDNVGSALYRAAERGYRDIVEELLNHGASINQEGGQRGTSIQAAAENCHSSTVQYLIERGAVLNTRNRFRSPLQSAAMNGQEGMVRSLVAAGADLEYRDGYGGTVLLCAITSRKLGIVRFLLESGADINNYSSINGYHVSPLRTAIAGDDTNMIRLLLHSGARVNNQDSEGFTAVHHAAAQGSCLQLLPILVDEFKADLQLRLINGNLGIHSAAGHRRSSGVQFFLDHGLDINSKNFIGRTPLHYAAEAGHIETVKFLLDHGADSQAKESEHFMTPLDLVELHISTTCYDSDWRSEMFKDIAELLRGDDQKGQAMKTHDGVIQ